jgi:hypothetical protein
MSFIPLGILAASGAGGGGSYESIATATGTGSSGTITFSSIPATYASLQIRVLGRSSTAADTTFFTVQYDGNAMTNFHFLRGNGDTASAGNTNVPVYVAADNSTANIMGVGIIDILDYTNTTRNKTSRSFGGWSGNGAYTTNERLQLASFFRDNTSAITSISLILNAGNWTTNSVISLYGIKG